MPAFCDLRQQGIGATHGVRISGHALCATVLLLGDQLGTFQDGDVFLYGCERHLVPVGQLADGRVRGHHPGQDVASGGVSQGAEQAVEMFGRRLLICNHMVMHGSTIHLSAADALIDNLNMAIDEGLAERIREALGTVDTVERKMFGGLAFMARGHMFIGIAKGTLMVRVGPTAYAAALARPHAREMDFTGRPMKGYVFVDPPGYEADTALEFWVKAGLSFVATLPPK